MKILDVNFFNFRNLKDTSFKLSSKINIFYGKNAQGKKSILETIYFNSTGFSFRTKKALEIIKYNKSDLIGHLSYENNIGISKLSIKYSSNQGAKKEFYFNKKRISQTDFYGKINIIAYIPEDIMLINGSPKIRRDFFDMEISQVDREYLENIKKFNKLLKIRNKYIKENKIKNEEYSVYEDEYIKYSAKIILRRIDYIKSISIILNLLYRKLFNSEQELNIKYENQFQKNQKLTQELVEEELKKEIIIKREQEKRYKFSLVGPHRDDYIFMLNGHEAKNTASQGEKKSIIFSLKLSEIDIVKKNKKENPIIIIDDITSYFDEERRNSVINFLYKNNVQVLISSTEKLSIEASNFYVEKGIIEKI